VFDLLRIVQENADFESVEQKIAIIAKAFFVATSCNRPMKLRLSNQESSRIHSNARHDRMHHQVEPFLTFPAGAGRHHLGGGRQAKFERRAHRAEIGAERIFEVVIASPIVGTN
ncbi:hypothetical protein, partial [Bradyrhizobium sp. S3.2.12]|uniref:hypothetical protein n=1 Tax=Bradyrhizobium sp. S3.2.12 TaxID=3156387 RepID=UPI003397000A